MNNNYTYFNPNSFNRAIPTSAMRINPMMPVSPLPRFSSLLGGSKALSTGAASASKVTFSGILNGASKTLGVINQAIPVFYQVKPIWNNARTMFRVVKEINSSDKTTSKDNINTASLNKSNIEKKGDSSPTFFA